MVGNHRYTSASCSVSWVPYAQLLYDVARCLHVSTFWQIAYKDGTARQQRAVRGSWQFSLVKTVTCASVHRRSCELFVLPFAIKLTEWSLSTVEVTVSDNASTRTSTEPTYTHTHTHTLMTYHQFVATDSTNRTGMCVRT